MSAEKAIGIGLDIAAATGSMLGIGDKRRNRQQIEQQKKLTEIQVGANKELADYSQGLQYDMWNKTNYEAQRKHMEEAGLNPSLMYGMSGGGGTTTGSTNAGSATGGSASDSASQKNADVGMGLMLSQINLMQAQAKKAEAEANKLSGIDTDKGAEELRGIKFNNDLNATLKDTTIDKLRDEAAMTGINAEKLNAEWETLKATGYASGNFADVNNRIAKQMIAEMEQAGVDLANAKTEGDIKKAEKIIKDFEAELAKEGIAPNSPFYVKIIGDLLGKINLNPLKAIKTNLK